MRRRKILWPIIGLCLLGGLAACDRPEEPLTPPAAMEKRATPSHRVDNNASTSPKAAAGEDRRGGAEFLQAGDAEIEIEQAAFASGSPATEPQAETDTIPAPPEPVSLFPAEMLSTAAAHICFFSFNTGAEYYQLKRMVNQINKASTARITVTEYQILDGDPYDSFVALLKSGKQCDGVVLSGHHTDEFYGERSDGDLEVEDLEELACDPRYSAWFANVKALWLQGCNTAMPVFHNEDMDDDDYRISASPINLMERWLDPDDMEDTVEDMFDLLEENINYDNMVNHYMRVFPGATVYGWSNKAPGEQSGAQKSIPYHIAQVSRLVDDDERFFQNPLQTRLPDTAARRYSEVLYGVLKRPDRPGEDFPAGLNEDTFIQGWRNHGDFRYRYAFDNHDIEAFPALGNSDNEILKQLKGLMCLLAQLDGDYGDLDDMSMTQVAEYILRDRNLSSYNSYLLWAMLRNMPQDSPDYARLRERLSKDAHLIRELKFAASGSGYRQQDARAFLAMLAPEEPEEILEEEVIATTGAADQESTDEPANEKPVTGGTVSVAEPESGESQTQPAKPPAEPWYMNEDTGDAESSDDSVYEFETETRS